MITICMTQAEVDAIQGPKHIWRDGAVWRVYTGVDNPAPSLAEAKAAKWLEIKAMRDDLSETGGYQVAGKWFHSDQKSRSQQLGLVILGASIPAATMWKTMDGSFVEMTQALAGQILGAAALSDIAIYTAAETHRIAMEASDNPSSYDFASGWPSIFGG